MQGTCTAKKKLGMSSCVYIERAKKAEKGGEEVVFLL